MLKKENHILNKNCDFFCIFFQMDTPPGRCWVCDNEGTLWCSGCRFAHYCSLKCLKRDKARHFVSIKYQNTNIF